MKSFLGAMALTFFVCMVGLAYTVQEQQKVIRFATEVSKAQDAKIRELRKKLTDDTEIWVISDEQCLLPPMQRPKEISS